MKNLVLLLALAAATPALSQTPDAPTVVNSPVAEANLSVTWEFTPDFLRDRNTIVWNMAGSIYTAVTTGAGVPQSETIFFANQKGEFVAFARDEFDKTGKLGKMGQPDANSAPFVPTTTSDNKSALSLQTTFDKKQLKRQFFALDFASGKRTLTSHFDARGRHSSDVFADENGKPLRTIQYIYDAKGLSKITDGAANFIIERDADGKMRSVSATQNGLLARSATPIRNDKGAIIGTRIEDYQSGILQEVNEITREGGDKSSRVSQTSSDKTVYENGQQSNEKKFEFRVDISPPKTPAVAAVEVRKRTLYKNAKIATEELFRNGVLTQRSQFNENGIIENVTDFNADGSVASEVDTRKVPYANGGITRRK